LSVLKNGDAKNAPHFSPEIFTNDLTVLSWLDFVSNFFGCNKQSACEKSFNELMLLNITIRLEFLYILIFEIALTKL